MAQKRKPGFQISYVTITYRSVAVGLLGLLSLIFLGMYFTFPTATNRMLTSVQVAVGKMLNKLGLGGTASGAGVEPGPQQAHFTNIDGIVRVKKASSTTWQAADYSVALEKNDVIQTSPEGIAKIVFTDGTNYTVKPDSLIVIQENFLNASAQTQVAVQVTTGTVDLATANMVPGSKSQVSVAGATATFPPESSAEVHNDVHNDQHTILVKRGSAEVVRGRESVKLADNEKLSIPSNESQSMIKTREIGAPLLLGPFDNQQISITANDPSVTFYWKEVEGVHTYHVRVSKNQFFTAASIVFDKNVTGAQLVLRDLPIGTYYWEVRSLGDDGKESVESQKSKFTLVPKGDDNSIALELGSLVQHGHVIEVRGRTEPGARVMVNGQEAVTDADGTFHHFTNPLPTGDNMITVTAQNSKGQWSTKQQTITIQ